MHSRIPGHRIQVPHRRSKHSDPGRQHREFPEARRLCFEVNRERRHIVFKCHCSGDGARRAAQVGGATRLQYSVGIEILRPSPAEDPNTNDTLSYFLDSAPAGASLSPSRAIVWTPTSAQLGVHDFTVRVVDAAGHSDSETFRITVEAANHAPRLAEQADERAPSGGRFTRALNATDPGRRYSRLRPRLRPRRARALRESTDLESRDNDSRRLLRYGKGLRRRRSHRQQAVQGLRLCRVGAGGKGRLVRVSASGKRWRCQPPVCLRTTPTRTGAR